MENEKQKKNEREVSLQVQENFVNSIAAGIVELATNREKWKKGWKGASISLPYNPQTRHVYSGSNMIALLITGLVRHYDDDRWLTFNQVKEFNKAHKANAYVRKGEHGTHILRPKEILFTVAEDGKWHILNAEETQKYRQDIENGIEREDVKRRITFYDFTVFNAAQMENFPPKETLTTAINSEVERDEFVDNFIASSGIRVRHGNFNPVYRQTLDVIELPLPENFVDTAEYLAAKLHEFFHATGHETRENRFAKDSTDMGSSAYAFEEMRAEIFSLLAGNMLHLPVTEENSAAYVNSWNHRFSGGDAKAVFRAAAESAKIVEALCQYANDMRPTLKWFPPKEEWPDLVEKQKERDAKDMANGPAAS